MPFCLISVGRIHLNEIGRLLMNKARFISLILIALPLGFAGCQGQGEWEKKPVAFVVGEVFPNGPQLKRDKIRIEDEGSISELIAALNGEAIRDRKENGLAAFSIHFLDSSSIRVEIAENDLARIINGRPTRIDSKKIVAILQNAVTNKGVTKNGEE